MSEAQKSDSYEERNKLRKCKKWTKNGKLKTEAEAEISRLIMANVE